MVNKITLLNLLALRDFFKMGKEGLFVLRLGSKAAFFTGKGNLNSPGCSNHQRK